MEQCLWDWLFEYALTHHQSLLEDRQGFEALHTMVHCLLTQLQRQERRGVYERLTRVNNN